MRISPPPRLAANQSISIGELSKALDEIKNGQFEADIGGHILKKRIRFKERVKAKGENNYKFRAPRSSIHLFSDF